MKNYIKGLLRIIKNNVLYYLKKRQYYIKFSQKKRYYNLKVGNRSISIAYLNRAGFYAKGIESRLSQLVESFGVNNEVIIGKNSVIVDVGANIGEFSMYCSEKCKKVYAFEPDKSVIPALKNNLSNYSNIILNEVALSEKTGEISFFLKGNSADSSIINNGSKNIDIIKTIRFEDYFKKNIKTKINLFKCDAEGAEPEVLLGVGDAFKEIEYIAIDCGPERGINNESTDKKVIEILKEYNFRIINDYKNNNRGIIIFKNIKY